MPIDSDVDWNATMSMGDTHDRGPQSLGALFSDGKPAQSGKCISGTPRENASDEPPVPAAEDRVVTLESSKLANFGPLKGHVDTKATNAGAVTPVDALLAQFRDQKLQSEEKCEAPPSDRTSNDKEGDIQYQKMKRSVDTKSGAEQPSNPISAVMTEQADNRDLPTTRPSSAVANEQQPKPVEVERLKRQLAHAQSQISRLDHELTQTRSVHTGPDPRNVGGSKISPPGPSDSTWLHQDPRFGDTSDDSCNNNFSRTREIWGSTKGPHAPNAFDTVMYQPQPSPAPWLGAGRPFVQNLGHGQSFPIIEGYRGRAFSPQEEILMPNGGVRRAPRFPTRIIPSPGYSNDGAGLTTAPHSFHGVNGHLSPSMVHGVNSGQASPSTSSMYSQQFGRDHIETSLSPYASEFESRAIVKNEETTPEVPTYLPPTEPLNYRRLLDRNVNCNWKYIVDKIVCNNDQQASIFLQQKLKVGTPEQKYEIVEGIVAQAYPLMINRFGNFLVQRCFEHGTPEQVIKIAEAIRGHTLNLSMDPFGCHVVQKAFDSVPEEYKAIMVHELLRRIPETVIHRYACHVWQKLFELRWTETPPQIMKYVNESLRGMWHEVALGETGSLVVQNIFENCLEEDKRPCIEEVLANIDIVAHGQFGNWCIQHICEHGGPPDRSRAIDHVIRYAAEYSTDQFASKVVEKCLKIGGSEFLGRYLDRVCEGRRDRTRIPLIDIASDQYGNYLIQWVLNNANAQHRDMVAAHIRKHMVSLRGSKFGSRVGMLCTNHAVATRPGPGAGPGMGGRMGPGPRYGAGGYR